MMQSVKKKTNTMKQSCSGKIKKKNNEYKFKNKMCNK